MDPMEEDVQDMEYRLWKKNTPYLYDLLITHALDWPSLTCQWFPDVEQRPGKPYKIQRLLLGTHTDGDELNHLQIAMVQTPNNMDKVDTLKYEEFTNEIGGYGGYNDASIRVTQKIAHEGEVNRARYQYENPNIIATKSVSGDVFIFDRTMHESFPKENEPCNPALRLKGHNREGFGLEWNPHKQKSSHLLSADYDGVVCEWDVSAATKEEKTMDPLRIYACHEKGINDISWHLGWPDLFASAGDDGMLNLYDTRHEAAEAAVKCHAHQTSVNGVAFNPFNEHLLATCSSDKTSVIWDLRNMGTKVHTLGGHQDEVYQIAWSPFHESVLATGATDKHVHVYDLARMADPPADPASDPPELLFKHVGHTAPVSDLCWDPDTPWMLASTAEDNSVHVWRMASRISSQEEHQ
ncbi:histone-binding protein RBBP7-like protein [Syncephalastrum racemosum]|uniref:Histone-binding protein RBBP7-like protein n=1 Tax=Syncephalastrum racemosum TaxID=13706 RepID=A0A1X2HP62_SYNRA|nr:histone-binding protein RBBP7-like protein [Syncephalastrum racemosum]